MKICGGCGNEIELRCSTCEILSSCKVCNKTTKSGHLVGGICTTCWDVVLSHPEEEGETEIVPTLPDAYEEYGFDHSWEL